MSKGLYINIGLQHYTEDQVQKATAHMDKSTTMVYPAQHKPVFEEINVVITAEMLGGKL